MKLLRLCTLLHTARSSNCDLANAFGVASYSTRLATAKGNFTGKQWKGSMNQLYRRISPVGDPNQSIVPLLDQWVKEGRDVDREQLMVFIKELRYYKRFAHALEISMWMSDRMYFPLTSGDVASRLDLISRVRGIEQAEDFFNNLSKRVRGLEVYSVLVSCYARERYVEKAEAIMEKMRELGLARRPLVYNCMLNLYYQTGNYKKLDSLIYEMEEKGIGCDKFSLSIQLSAYAAAGDVGGVDKTLAKIESNSDNLDWAIYATAASAYLKVGLLDKALAMLKKSEGLITRKKGSKAYDFLMTQYAACGQRDEVLRLWENYKIKFKVYNQGYFSVIPSVLKFDDLETAEKICEEWESQNLRCDIRIPNFLIGAYCRKGLTQKAETLINRVILKGVEPNSRTWYYLATGYLQNNQIPKVVEAMKEALMICQTGWKLNKECLAACLIYFKDEGDMEGAKKFVKILRDKEIFSGDLEEKLLNYFQNSIPNLDIVNELGNDALVGDNNSDSIKAEVTN